MKFLNFILNLKSIFIKFHTQSKMVSEANVVIIKEGWHNICGDILSVNTA